MSATKPPRAEDKAAFFNAQQSPDPQVCRLQGETLSDGSQVFNVVFHEEIVFCLDEERACRLIEKINQAVKEAQ